MWGSILGSVASTVIGGLMNKKKSGGETVSNTVDYKAMVRSAEAAGINPLTALRNGGAAGFSQTHTPTFANRSFLADAFSNGIQSALNYDPHAQKTVELEQGIMTAQLERLQSENEILNRGLGAQTGQSLNPLSASVSNNVRTSIRSSPLRETNYQWRINQAHQAPQNTEIGKTEATNPYPKWTRMGINPSFPNAEQWEDRYGEIAGGILGGGINVIADYAHQATRFAERTYQDYQRGITTRKAKPTAGSGDGTYYPSWLPKLSFEFD